MRSKTQTTSYNNINKTLEKHVYEYIVAYLAKFIIVVAYKRFHKFKISYLLAEPSTF